MDALSARIRQLPTEIEYLILEYAVDFFDDETVVCAEVRTKNTWIPLRRFPEEAWQIQNLNKYFDEC